jgi:hypothetical protein
VVFISDLPEIDIEEELVTSEKDYETKLKCVVHAEPKAKVYWLKDDAPVSDLGHVHIFAEGNRHYYRIVKTQVSDFGKYKCIATSSKGTTTSKEIELTGMFLSLLVNTLLTSYPADTHVKWVWWRYFKFFKQIFSL